MGDGKKQKNEAIEITAEQQQPEPPLHSNSELQSPKLQTSSPNIHTELQRPEPQTESPPKPHTEPPPKPRLIAFEVTRRCRFNCNYCRANAGLDPEEVLSTQQCKKIIASVARFCKCTLIITGGEPMERSDIYELIKYAGQKGLKPVMATCGYFINEDSISKLKKAGILVLSFSLDGCTAESNDRFRGAEGAFDAVMKATEIARAAGVRFQINTTITKANYGEIIGIAELAKKLGASCFNPFIFVPTGRGTEMADAVLDPVEYEAMLGELLRIKLESEIEIRITCAPQFSRVWLQAQKRELLGEPSGCMGGVGFGFISYRGDVQTCGFLDFSAGNIIENNFDFGKIWTQSKFLEQIRNRSEYTGRCRVCEYRDVCGGCRARAYAVSGDYLGDDPVCDYKPGGK